MNYLKRLRSLGDMKLIYLHLLDRPHNPYTLTKKQLAFDNLRFYANVNHLAQLGLLNEHPLLTQAEPDATVLKKAKSTSLTVSNTSYRVLLWALGDYREIPEVSEEEALVELRRLARQSPTKCLSDWD